MLACPMCAKVFRGTKRKYRLDRHMLVHWGLKPFKCPHCPYRSTQQNNLNRHMRNVHWQAAEPICGFDESTGDSKPRQGSPRQELPEECCPSPKKSEEAPVACVTISHRRKVAALLEVEAVLADEEDDDEMTFDDEAAGGGCVYTGGSPSSSCPVCGKIFEGNKRKYRLERHLTIHTGEKPFSCPLCVYRANQKEHLSRHIRNLHRLEPSEVPSSPQHAHTAAS
ncbi:Zinc finger protein 516 [Chionoecetes opilio]|uniref:Zinc finger protein 516 n=1 Tax=Chionoecetes opilio TaxID=41210 RepID=A0A8J5CZ15_CHIOP|nr:Zinc finger protein 516 [Chionoecetes opilio]